MDFIFEL